MERAAGQPTAGKPCVDGVEFERYRSMLRSHAFDLRDARSQIIDDGGFTHDIHETRAVYVFAICSYQSGPESSAGGVSTCGLPQLFPQLPCLAFAKINSVGAHRARQRGTRAVMTTAFDLNRFVTAQADSYGTALAELRRGAKRSHWMWFIFPQIAGLGRSDMARRYAIGSLDEARAYLAHPLLGARLRECVGALQDLTGTTAQAVFGPVDAMKLRSSLTLFISAEGGDLFSAALERWFGGEADPATTARIG